MSRITSQDDAIRAAQNDTRLSSVDNTNRKYEGPISVLREYHNIEEIRTTIQESTLIIDSPNEPTKFSKF